MQKYNYLRIACITADDPPGGGTPPPADPPEGTPPPTDPPAGDGSDNEDPPGAGDLGDAGKQALDRMKLERKTAKDEAAAEKARADALQAKLDGKEAEHAAEQEKQRVAREALDVANQKILKSEVKAAAKGVLTDPQDAFKFLDLAALDVDEDGNVDEAAIADALKDLVTAKPYLAAQGSERFQGGADGGARKETDKSIDQEIAEASAAGDHARAITLKRHKQTLAK
jgi:hypothetical protein